MHVNPTPAAVYQDFDCVFPLTTCYFVLLLEFIIYFLLAIYLDNIVGDANGEGGAWGARTAVWGWVGGRGASRSPESSVYCSTPTGHLPGQHRGRCQRWAKGGRVDRVGQPHAKVGCLIWVPRVGWGLAAGQHHSG